MPDNSEVVLIELAKLASEVGQCKVRIEEYVNIARERRREFSEIKSNVSCLKNNFEKYEDYLKLAVEREIERKELRRRLLQSTSIWILIGILSGSVIMLWDSFVSRFK